MSPNHNIAKLVTKNAKDLSSQKAIISLIKNKIKQITFEEVDQFTDRYAFGFNKAGITKGMKVLMLVPHSIEFYLIIFSLFKTGAVPIIIDPGMKKKDLLKCIDQADAEAMVGIPIAFLLKKVFKKNFKSIKINIIVGPKLFFKAISLNSFNAINKKEHFEIVNVNSNDMAAILFTSGSTGVAKGVVYEHGMFFHQTQIIKEMFQLKPGLSDLPCFPLFGLFSLALGVTLYLPDIDTSFPAKADPAKIVKAINKYEITNCFASPAIWEKVINYCINNNLRLHSLKNSMAAGAPINYSLLHNMKKYLLSNEGDMWVPYGATESLPVSVITASERLKTDELHLHKIASINVGKAVNGVQIKIIESTEHEINSIQQAKELNALQIGEIIVKSASTTKVYYKQEEKTKLAKIKDDNSFWHRMGDVGFLDAESNLWYCGRKDHVVKINDNITLYSIPCELIANQHDSVFRSALVSVKNQSNTIEPVIVVELKRGIREKNKKYIANEILSFIQSQLGHSYISKLLFYKYLPVDVRHNAKINREYLAHWSQNQIFFYEISK